MFKVNEHPAPMRAAYWQPWGRELTVSFQVEFIDKRTFRWRPHLGRSSCADGLLRPVVRRAQFSYASM